MSDKRYTNIAAAAEWRRSYACTVPRMVEVAPGLAYALKKGHEPRAFTLIRCDFDGAAAWIQVTDQRTPTSEAIETLKTAYPSPHP